MSGFIDNEWVGKVDFIGCRGIVAEVFFYVLSACPTGGTVLHWRKKVEPGRTNVFQAPGEGGRVGGKVLLDYLFHDREDVGIIHGVAQLAAAGALAPDYGVGGGMVGPGPGIFNLFLLSA